MKYVNFVFKYCRYSGNTYLSITSQNSTHSHSKRTNAGITVGAIGGGIVITAFILIISIFMYRRKFRRKDIVLADSKGSVSENILDHGEKM